MAMVSGAATTASVNASRQSSVLSYVQSLFSRPVETNSVQGSSATATAVDGINSNSIDDSAVANSPNTPNSGNNNTRDSTLYTDGVTSPAVCSACQITSPEVMFFNQCLKVSFICVILSMLFSHCWARIVEPMVYLCFS